MTASNHSPPQEPQRARSRLRKVLTRALLSFAGIVLVCAVFEVFLRIVDYPQNLGAPRVPKHQERLLEARKAATAHCSRNSAYLPTCKILVFSHEFNVVGVTDSLGYLGTGKPDPEQRDLLVFGCSFAYGFGVEQSETFASLLGAYNAGLWGLSFPHHARAFEKAADAVKPRRAIWVLYPPHLITATRNAWRARRSVDPKKHPWTSGSFAQFNKTRISDLILASTGWGYNRSDYYTREYSLYDKQDAYPERGYEQFEKAVKHVVERSTSRDIPIIPLLMPSKAQIQLELEGTRPRLMYGKGELDAGYPMERMKDILEKNGIPRERHIDLLPVLAGTSWRDLYFKRDAHLNPDGCKFVADCLEERLKTIPLGQSR